MDSIAKKASFVKGLFEGLQIDENQKEGKILKHIVDLLGDIVDEIGNINESQLEIKEYLEYIDNDLANLEDYVYDEQEDYGDESGYIEIECPNCNETVYFDQDSFNDEQELLCPNCHRPVYIDYQSDEQVESQE